MPPVPQFCQYVKHLGKIFKRVCALGLPVPPYFKPGGSLALSGNLCACVKCTHIAMMSPKVSSSCCDVFVCFCTSGQILFAT